MAVKNHNFRFNEEKEAEKSAWEILHSKEVKEDFRSQNEFVVAAINDYYERHLAIKREPYLETREKEETFVKEIVEAVEQKVLANLPGLAGMYMMQQQSLLSVMGLQGMLPVGQPMQVANQATAVTPEQMKPSENGVNTGFEAHGTLSASSDMEAGQEAEPDANDYLDFSLCGE